MKVKIKIMVILDPKESAVIDKIKNDIIAVQPKMQKINNIETSSIVIENCYHDEGKPCEVIYAWIKK